MVDASIYHVTACPFRAMTIGAIYIPNAYGIPHAASFVIWNRFMTLSIRTIIRGLLVPDHRISCRRKFWMQILKELDRRGEGRHEAGVFLLGKEKGGRLEVKDTVYYEELDPHAYSTGVCVLHGDSFAKLWAICRERRLTVVADAHTHRLAALQSEDDRTNPMVARSGQSRS
jgi:hypothetical protein